MAIGHSPKGKGKSCLQPRGKKKIDGSISAPAGKKRRTGATEQQAAYASQAIEAKGKKLRMKNWSLPVIIVVGYITWLQAVSKHLLLMFGVLCR